MHRIVKRYIRFVAFFFMITSMIACKEKKGPEHLHYDEDKIQAIMIDMYLVSSITKNHEPEMEDSLRNLLRIQLEEIHDVDIDKVEEDLVFIKADEEWYSRIHKVVKDSIEALDKLQRPKKGSSKKPTPKKNTSTKK